MKQQKFSSQMVSKHIGRIGGEIFFCQSCQFCFILGVGMTANWIGENGNIGAFYEI